MPESLDAGKDSREGNEDGKMRKYESLKVWTLKEIAGKGSKAGVYEFFEALLSV